MCRIGDLVGRTLDLEVRPRLETLKTQSVASIFFVPQDDQKRMRR
jgi:hypothetical protein